MSARKHYPWYALEFYFQRQGLSECPSLVHMTVNVVSYLVAQSVQTLEVDRAAKSVIEFRGGYLLEQWDYNSSTLPLTGLDTVGTCTLLQA